MFESAIGLSAAAVVGCFLCYRIYRRLQLSVAKHPSLSGHARLSKRLARALPRYEYTLEQALNCDGAAEAIVIRRKAALKRLSDHFSSANSENLRLTRALQPSVSDMQFTNSSRVPFQFRQITQQMLPLGAFATASRGVELCDPDGNWSYDIGGSYGVNLLGYDFYKACIERGAQRVAELGPVLGPYHPLVAENVEMLKTISGLDEVSFHMSGTEAVMQAVGLARFHTRRTHAVMFCGAYHGWWDGVQPGVGSQRTSRDTYLLKDMSDAALRVLETRHDLACVLINPLQALHPNRGATSDAMLIASDRSAGFDKAAYAAWLQKLRDVCTRRSIPLIFDEVFVGFRLGQRGAQEFFGVQADLVTYGKTLGGGLPIGALCGRADLMQRFREDYPADVCFARGTFNSHPYVMASTNEFLRFAVTEAFAAQISADQNTWNDRAQQMNQRLESANLPMRIENLSSVWILLYRTPNRFNWLLQYYLRAEGLSLSWVGTGRFIFSHNYSDDDFSAVIDRFVAAGSRMREDGWWAPLPALQNSTIKRTVLTEVLSHKLKAVPKKLRPAQNSAASTARASSDPAVHRASDTRAL